MKTKSTLRSFLLGCSSLLFVSTLHAADGTWTADSAGDWGILAYWNSGLGPIADGADFTATFDNVITAARTVTLESARTIGNITAADISHDYTISGANILTLDRTDTTKPTIHVPQNGRTLTINSVIDGADGLLKTGAGTLHLGGANTYSGGTDISGGRVNAGNNSAMGTGPITISANAIFGAAYNGTGYTLANSLIVNPDVTATLNPGNQYQKLTLTGPVSGNGDVFWETGAGGAAGSLTFSSDSNTITGMITVRSIGNGVGYLTVNSLADSTVEDPNPIRLGGSGTYAGAIRLGSGTATPLLFNYRQIELNGTGASGGIIENNNATATNTITINTNLLVSANGNKTLTLAGSNAGDNTFAGIIGDATTPITSVISLAKAGAGKWILTGVNTYTGSTAVQDGTLEIRGAGQLGGGSYAGAISIGSGDQLIVNSTANQTFSGVISGLGSLTKDNSGILTLTNASTHSGGTTVTAGTLSLGDGTNHSSLNDFSTLSVASGAVVNLNYSGSDSVFFLNLGGSPAAVGTWGATGSGATHIDDTYFTGTGVINNLNGNSASLNIAFWDGGAVDIETDGNASGTTSNGIWDTTTKNWDFGFVPHGVWPNTTSDKAVFQRTTTGAHTVTLGSDITLGALDYRGTPNTADQLYFGDASEDNHLNFGGAATITTNDYYVTFRSGITGSPTINYTARQNDNNSKLTLAPAGSLTMTLGAINMIVSPINAKNSILELGGSSTGNSASSVTWSNVAQQMALNKVGTGTWTLNGGWDNTPMGDSAWRVQGGTLILNGTYNVSHVLEVQSGGTLSGNATLSVTRTGATEHVRILAGGTMAPGITVGTINVNDKTTIAGKLQIEVNGATSDLLAITGDLDLSALTDILEVVELGAASLTDYTVVTYTGALTGTFDTQTLPAGYTVDYNTPGEIHLLVSGVPANPYATWSGGAAFDADANNDGVSNGMAFLLGASGPNVSALDKMPVVTHNAGALVMTFSMRNAANRGTATLSVQHSSDLGMTDPWESALVPDTDQTVNDVVFDITAGDPLNGVQATIPASKANAGKLFGRLVATE